MKTRLYLSSLRGFSWGRRAPMNFHWVQPARCSHHPEGLGIEANWCMLARQFGIATIGARAALGPDFPKLSARFSASARFSQTCFTTWPFWEASEKASEWGDILNNQMRNVELSSSRWRLFKVWAWMRLLLVTPIEQGMQPNSRKYKHGKLKHSTALYLTVSLSSFLV